MDQGAEYLRHYGIKVCTLGVPEFVQERCSPAADRTAQPAEVDEAVHRHASPPRVAFVLDALASLMQRFTVRAPAPGMVIYYRNWRGEKLTTGGTIRAWDPVVAELPDLSQMKSVTYVNEVDVQKVASGQSVEIGLDADPDFASAWAFGIILAIMVAVVIIGGITRIANVTSKLVPTMCAGYCVVCIILIVVNLTHVPEMLAKIVADAFAPSAAFGGW